MSGLDSVQRIARRVDAMLRAPSTRKRVVALAVRGLREERRTNRPNGAELFPDEDLSVARAAFRLLVLRDAVCDGPRVLRTATSRKHAIETRRGSFRSAIRDLPALALFDMAKRFGEDPFTGNPQSSGTRRERVEAWRWLGQVEAALRPTAAAGHHPLQDVKRADELTLTEVSTTFDIPASAISKACRLNHSEPGYLVHRRADRAVFIRRDQAECFAQNYSARREVRGRKSLSRSDDFMNSSESNRRRKARN